MGISRGKKLEDLFFMLEIILMQKIQNLSILFFHHKTSLRPFLHRGLQFNDCQLHIY